MPRQVTLNITLKGIAMLLVAAVLVWLVVAFDKILLTLFLATLLAVAIDPLVDRMEVAHVPRALAIVVTYLVLLGIISAVLSLLVPIILTEVTQLTDNLPQIIDQLGTLPQRLIVPYFPSLASSLTPADLKNQLGGQAGKAAGGAGKLVLDVGTFLTSGLISLLLVLVVGFFLTADARFAPRLIARFFAPSSRPTVAKLASEMGGRLGHWVRAQILVGLFFGVTFGIGLALLRVPYAFALGAAGALLEIIPYVGGVIVTAIAMLVALTVAPWVALAVLVLEIVVAMIESHVVYPKLVGDIVGLHPLTIIIALFIGAELKGVMGAFLAVPVAVVIQVLFDHYYRFEDTGVAVTSDETVVERTTVTTQTTQAVPRS